MMDYFEIVLNSLLQNVVGGFFLVLFLFLIWLYSFLHKNRFADFLRKISVLLWCALAGGLAWTCYESISPTVQSQRTENVKNSQESSSNDKSELPPKEQTDVSSLHQSDATSTSSALNDDTNSTQNDKKIDEQKNRHFFLFGVFCLALISGVFLFVIIRFCTSRSSNNTEFKYFWEVFFATSFLTGLILLATWFFIRQPGSEFHSLLPGIYKGVRTFGKDWGLPVIVGIVAWLTYVANRETIDRPYFSVFFVDDSLYNDPKVEKELKKQGNRRESVNIELENENKLVEVVPFFEGKQPFNSAENEEITVSICIKNTRPPQSIFHRGAPGSHVSILFYMPPGIVPYRAYRRDSVAESRQVLEACEYGLFKDRSYIAVPVAFNVSPPAITMLSREEAVVVEITSRIERPLTEDFLGKLQSIGVQITSNEGITADVKWLYLDFCKITPMESQEANALAKDIGYKLPLEGRSDRNSNDPWIKACNRLFRSLNDGIFIDEDEPCVPSLVEKRIDWNSEVNRLLRNKKEPFWKLIERLQDTYENLPGHNEWTENHCYDVLSKLLNAVWYLMMKELVPQSPDFQTSRSFFKFITPWNRKSCSITSFDAGIPIKKGFDDVKKSEKSSKQWKAGDMSYELWKDVQKYHSGIKTYIEYKAFCKPGMNELVVHFYENCEKKKYLTVKNYNDWRRFQGKQENLKFDSSKKQEAAKKGVLSIREFLNDFTFVHQEQLFELCCSKPNCRSTPQRAFPIASVLPTSGSVGVLELGCHRGDVGLALLNLDFILANPGKYLTEEFINFIGDPRSLRWVCNPIQKYFGVTDTLVSDDDWDLAQWGPNREMREKLKRFHYDFRSGSNERFRKVKADLCDVNSYVMEAIGFFKEMDNLVVLTSYALCFIPFEKRRKLAQAIRVIQKYYEAANPRGKFFWYNQGRSVDEIFEAESSKKVATRFHLGEMCFKGAFLFGVDLLRITNDLHTGWRKPRFSLLCQTNNKNECKTFVNNRRQIDDDRKEEAEKQDPRRVNFESYVPIPWNDGVYCVDGGKYEELIYQDPYVAQETSIYANIVFPMLENPGSGAGKVQRLLESQKMCYAGSNADVIETLADMEKCRTIWREAGVPVLDYVVCDSAAGTARLFQELPERLHLAFDSVRVVPAFSGIDRKRWERICSDYYSFDAVVKNGLAQYEKLIIEPRRAFSGDDDREYVLYVPIIESKLKAIALPVYMNKELITDGKFAFETRYANSLHTGRLQVINMAKRLALDAYRAAGCQDFGVVEIIYSERFGLQVSRIQPLPYFWEYDPSITPVDVVKEECFSKNNNQAKEKRFCEGIGLPKEALLNGFYYSWTKMYGSQSSERNFEKRPIDTLLSVLCNMAQRDNGDRRRFMHILWYDSYRRDIE